MLFQGSIVMADEFRVVDFMHRQAEKLIAAAKDCPDLCSTTS
jgi:hypothetical protein